jgi:hypothetical protein
LGEQKLLEFTDDARQNLRFTEGASASKGKIIKMPVISSLIYQMTYVQHTNIDPLYYACITSNGMKGVMYREGREN